MAASASRSNFGNLTPSDERQPSDARPAEAPAAAAAKPRFRISKKGNATRQPQTQSLFCAALGGGALAESSSPNPSARAPPPLPLPPSCTPVPLTSVPPLPPQASHHAPSLPEGWLESERGGGHVCGLCPVKTPLSSAYDPRLTAEQRWTPAQCVAACGKRKVVAVVDLTATDRYYDKRELAPFGVRHLKFATQGRGVPSERQMGEILEVLREVMPKVLDELASAVSGDTVTLGGGAVSGGQAAASDSIVIIHCTHGLNRTGYVIVRALVDLHGYSLVDALAAFAAVRPPGLWRPEYVKALHERYGGPQPKLPSPPEWARLEAHASEGGGGNRRGGAGGYNGGGGGGEEKEDPTNLFAGALVTDATGATYYQDRRRQWPYRTNTHGATLLQGMIDIAQPLLAEAVKALDEEDGGRSRQEGCAPQPVTRPRGHLWAIWHHLACFLHQLVSPFDPGLYGRPACYHHDAPLANPEAASPAIRTSQRAHLRAEAKLGCARRDVVSGEVSTAGLQTSAPCLALALGRSLLSGA